MTKRIFRSILAVSLAVLLASLLLIVGVLHGYFQDSVLADLTIRTAYIAHGIENEGIGYLEEDLPGGCRITLVDTDGTVLYDNREDPAQMENHADREEIHEAAILGQGRAVRHSDTLSEKTIYYALRLSDGTILRVSDTEYSVWRLVIQAMQPMALVLVLAFVLALVLASRVSRQLVQPINALDLSQPGDQAPYEELAPLLGKIRSQNRQIQKQMLDLKQRQEEFTTITENMSEGFLVLDHHTDILSYNTSALRLLGCPDAQAGGRESALTLNRSASFRSVVDGALSGKRSQQLLRENGRCCQVLGNPVLRDGEVVGAVVVILDITEREERENLRREFTANVSHELKTPLTSISGFAEIMQNGMVKPADVPRFAGNIYTESQRLISLVDDIMRLSRLDEEDVQLPSEDLDLLALAQDVARRLEPAAKEQGLTMAVQGSGSIRGVRSIVDEMVYNLCDNAVKYNRKGGSVTITVTEGPREVSLSVADTGIGIPAADRERVFERFYRVDKSHSKEIGGTGLGLSIVKHGAAFHNAQVRLESQEGKGTTVTLTFPRRYRV